MTTIGGLFLGVAAVLLGAKLEHLPLGAIYGPTAFLIVIGGTFGAILVSFPIHDIKRAFGEALGVAFRNINLDHRPLIEEILTVAALARKEGVLAVEGIRDTVVNNDLRSSLKYIIDGFDSETVEEILDSNSYVETEDLEAAAKVWEGAGGYSPTIGIIGAVLGLIFVMRSLDNPDQIGSGIAIAFVATVYGVGFANLMFIPLGTKIKRKAGMMGIESEIIKIGILGIQEGLNPYFLREKLEIFLDPKLRSPKEEQV